MVKEKRNVPSPGPGPGKQTYYNTNPLHGDHGMQKGAAGNLAGKWGIKCLSVIRKGH
jgi:hypothetical protein